MENQHFIRLIFDEDQGEEFIRKFAGAMAYTLDDCLVESENKVSFEQYKTSEGHHVFEVALTQELSNEKADDVANTIAQNILGDYTIEVSGPGHTIH